MKFDLNDYKVEDYDQETIEKYSFPAEKEVILKYMKGEQFFNRRQAQNLFQEVQQNSLLIVYGLTTFAVSYAFLQFPGGKVIRDKYDAKLSLPVRCIRRVTPFLALSIPLLIAKQASLRNNGYAK